jgi:hypothetical protein
MRNSSVIAELGSAARSRPSMLTSLRQRKRTRPPRGRHRLQVSAKTPQFPQRPFVDDGSVFTQIGVTTPSAPNVPLQSVSV